MEKIIRQLCFSNNMESNVVLAFAGKTRYNKGDQERIEKEKNPDSVKMGVIPVGQDERDIVEFSDEDGNTLLLEVMDYFFYNGEEFAVLCDADEEACDHCQETDCDCEDEQNLYIMKVVTVTGDDGEEMEEFISPDESLLEQLIEVVQARFSDEDDDDIEDEQPKG